MAATPANANATCVGPAAATAGKAESCEGCPNQASCASGAGAAAAQEAAGAMEFVEDRLALIKHKVLVLSGKGGVGKSSVATQLAFSLAAQGKSVGLLDVDICGPSLPRMLGLTEHEVHQSAAGWSPVYVNDNLGVMSIGFMLPRQDDAIIWRGPRKNGLIRQFLTDVDWGTLDYLIVDTPPGTSDEHLSVVQYLKSVSVDGAIVVTTPQEVAMMDVRKEINFCKRVGLNVLGVVENMAGMTASVPSLRFADTNGADVTNRTLQAIRTKCPELLDLVVQADVFAPYEGGPAEMARKMQVPFLGSIPLDPKLCQCAERGSAIIDEPDAPAATPMANILREVEVAVARAPATTTAAGAAAAGTS